MPNGYDLVVTRRNDLIENPTPRCACILVLDTSGSMKGEKIVELNKGVAQFIMEVKNDEFASCSVEVGCITAGPEVERRLPITPVHLIESVGEFPANGRTPLGKAVGVALDMLETRKLDYKSAGVPYYQPWLVIISDGVPTDEWQTAASRAHAMAENRKLVALPVGVENANMDVLSSFSNRPAKLLAGLKFCEFFDWLSKSMTAVSKSISTSDVVTLPSTSGWDSI